MSKTAFVVFILSFGIISCVQNVENNGSRVVMTQEGPVRGYKQPGRRLYDFYGVPYARVPTDENRYKAPLPAIRRPNMTIFEATDRTIMCAQGTHPEVDWTVMRVREQCLIANIFVPESEEKKIPILVYVHGGGFEFAYGDSRRLTDFAEQFNIILVNFNYRLGIVGNLCLGTKNAPGNAAMKDQIALLHWVKKNIEYFGGDPNKVTIAGCSSGGASVDLLALSKETRGLFRNVIVNSGSSLNSFSIQTDPIEDAINTAHILNLPKVYPSLQSLDTAYKYVPINYITWDRAIDINNLDTHYSPCIERNSKGSVLTDAPLNILKNNASAQIPILYAFTDMEAGREATFLSFDELLKTVRENFSKLLPPDLKFKDEDEKENVAHLVHEFYFINHNEKNESIALMDYLSDSMFIYGILKSAKSYVENGNDRVYVMEFSYVNEDSLIIPHTSIRRAKHCAQAQSVWDEDESNFTKEYKAVKTFMREVWANFIRTGDPSPKGSSVPTWPPLSVGATIGPILSVSNNVELKPSLEQTLLNRFAFWSNIYDKYYHMPIPPRNNIK